MVSTSTNPDSDAPLPPFPEPTEVLSSLGQMLSAFKTAQEELRTEVFEVQHRNDQLDGRQEELKRLQEHIAEQRATCEEQLCLLAERTTAVEQAREELEAHSRAFTLAQEAMDSDREALANQEDELQQIREEQLNLQRSLDQRQSMMDATERDLAAQVEQLNEAEQKFAADRDAFEVRATAARKKMEEIEHTKATLAEIQGQLTQEQQEVAAQRADLLGRIGRDIPAEIAMGPSEPSNTAPGKPSAAPAKRTELDSATKQFRKLRRDAKRKVIGA